MRRPGNGRRRPGGGDLETVNTREEETHGCD